jgi:hypothetical protein
VLAYTGGFWLASAATAAAALVCYRRRRPCRRPDQHISIEPEEGTERICEENARPNFAEANGAQRQNQVQV